MLAPYLGSTSDHIREEVLHLMIASFLNGNNNFDYFTVVDSIAKLLDDQKANVRFAATEALSTLVFKGDKNKICEILYEIVERREYNRLCDRFDAGCCPEFIEDGVVFNFPYHKIEVNSRASSRESSLSNVSQRKELNQKGARSRIGDSQVTSKEFSVDRIHSNGINNSNTFADYYSSGLKPSERMKNFNQSQVPLIQNNDKKSSAMIGEYNTNSYGLNVGTYANNLDAHYNPDSSKGINQNLRLLKTKMRLNSATSNESEIYFDNSKQNGFIQYNRNSEIIENKSGNFVSNDPELNNIAINNSAKKEKGYTTSIKQKPIKADHQVLKGINSTRINGESTDGGEYSTPNKRENKITQNPYETASGSKFMRSTQRSALGDDDTKYLTSEEIEKLADPKRGLNQLPTDISSKDWEVQVNSCNVLRSIAIHNCYLLDSSFFKTILADLIKIASSLRSSVCKNGLLALQDLFKNCSKHIEYDLEYIANILIKKSNDTNIFISAEAEKTLLSMCSYCNEQKVLTTIMAHSSNRSPQVKSKVAKCLEQIIVKFSNKFTSFKENSKVIDQLATYLSDASQEVRTDAKKAFNTLSQLCSKAEFEEMLNKSLSEQKYNKVKELLEKGFQTSMSEFNPTKQSFNRAGSNGSSRKQLVNGGNSSNGFDLEGGMSSSSKFKSSSSIPKIKGEDDVSPPDSKYSVYSKRNLNNSKYNSNGNNKFERNSDRNSTISVINSTANRRIQKIIPKDGNDRLANNTDVEDNKSTKSTPNKYSKQKKISRSSIKRLDETSVPRAPDFSKRDATDIEIVEEKDVFVQLNHPDSKISSKAAEVLLNNYEEYEKDVPNNLPIIFKSQSNLFCSNNENIRLKAEELIDKCVNRVKASLTVKSICNTISTTNNKAKLMLLEKLNKILPQVAEENPVLLSKHVLPVVYTLLDDKSKFIKKKTEDIVLTLYSLIGSALIEFSPSNKLQMILDII